MRIFFWIQIALTGLSAEPRCDAVAWGASRSPRAEAMITSTGRYRTHGLDGAGRTARNAVRRRQCSIPPTEAQSCAIANRLLMSNRRVAAVSTSSRPIRGQLVACGALA